jgi:four helix bundle protein
MTEMLFDFEKFVIYQRAKKFSDKVYELTDDYPQKENFGLVSQLRRASLSVLLNLAEGYGRYHKRDKMKFYRTARGSIYECVPALQCSTKRNYIKNKDYIELYRECFEISRRISGLIKKIEKRK